MINVEGDIVVSFSSNDSGKLILMLVINDGIPSTFEAFDFIPSSPKKYRSTLEYISVLNYKAVIFSQCRMTH